jgi:3-hydroxyisobutyrate dehydrogenase-like beta-hydroxyacid dehydrogenase
MAIDTVGFIGLGVMGSRMASRIAQAGWPVHVFDIRPEAAEAVARTHNGIVVEQSPKAVAEAADAVITMLPAGPDVTAVTLGPDGLAEGFGEGDVLIDMSSSQPWLTVELADTLKQRGIDMIDSPVSGGAGGSKSAVTGSLTLMIGGEAAVVDRCMPVFETMASHIFRTGKVGSGHALKTLNNLLSALNTVAATETLLIGKRFGLDPEIMVDVINESTGMNSAMKRNMKQEIISRKFSGGFAFDLKFKDFGIAMELARRAGAPAPISALAFELYRAAGIWLGDTKSRKSTEVVRWLDHMAGAELRKGE